MKNAGLRPAITVLSLHKEPGRPRLPFLPSPLGVPLSQISAYVAMMEVGGQQSVEPWVSSRLYAFLAAHAATPQGPSCECTGKITHTMGPRKTGTAFVVFSKPLDLPWVVRFGTRSIYHRLVYAIHPRRAYTDTNSEARRSRSLISERRVWRF